ncbi:MAG: DNA ligase [Candidatus Tyloplasma litorale]|nr:MAG: DNA ligase [Mycoplasmatales bacterium]
MKKIENKINNLVKMLNKWNYDYYVNDNPIVDDIIYDEKLSELFQLEKQYPHLIREDSPTQTVGKIASSSFKKTKHMIPMLSLKNAFNEGDLMHFNKQIIEFDYKGDYFVEPKIDGLSLSLIYEKGHLIKAVTRGDGNIGEDVTNNAKQISNIPLTINYKKNIEIRGEVYIGVDQFKKINEERRNNDEKLFANPRNAASGTMRQLDVLKVKQRGLKMIAYWAMNDEKTFSWKTQEETIINLEKLGFKTSELSVKILNIEDVISIIKKIEEKRYSLEYEIDGVVIKVNEYSFYEKIGYTSKFPKWAIAYKLPGEIKVSTLLNIFQTIGRTGRVTYNAQLSGVQLAGTWVQRATLHNADYIKDLDLRIGAQVKVKKAGDIIPKVISAIKDDSFFKLKKWKEDKKCKICGNKLSRTENEVDQYCINVDCPARMEESIIHFVSREAMNIKGLSTQQIKKFIELKFISEFSDIYYLKNKKEEILKLDGYQERSVNSLLNSIEESKKVSLDKFIFALGIRHIGKKTSKDLAKIFGSIEAMSKLKVENLIEQEDFGEVKSNSIISYFKDENNKKKLNNLVSAGLNPIFISSKKENDSILFGKKIVITGKIENMNREEAKEYFENLGAIVLSTISKNIDYLVIGEKPSLLKMSKVSKDKIINFNEIKKIIV